MTEIYCYEGIEKGISRLKRDPGLIEHFRQLKLRDHYPKKSERREAKARIAEKRKRRSEARSAQRRAGHREN